MMSWSYTTLQAYLYYILTYSVIGPVSWQASVWPVTGARSKKYMDTRWMCKIGEVFHVHGICVL